MAIDEKNMSAGVVRPQTEEAEDDAAAASEHGTLSLDDLRLRLDSPLFARDPGLAAPAQVPRLRELTWEHVVNPTSSQPIITGDEQIAEGTDREAGAAPKPIRVEDLLAAPVDPFAAVNRSETVIGSPSSPAAESSSDPADADAVVTDSSVADATGPGPVDDGATRPTRDRPAVPALPSFAAMLSGEVAEVLEVREATGVEDLVKPIEEPPPVARDTDPEVAGLAELIVRSTPVTGMPRVEAVRDSLRNETGSVPVVARVDEAADIASVTPMPPPPVSDRFAPPTPAVGVVATSPGPTTGSTPMTGHARPNTGAHPVVQLSAVEAELNRLAYLPDQEDDLGPVEVPAIAYSDVRSAEPVAAAPVLSQAELYTPRQSAAPVRHAYTDLVEKSMPAPRRRKRHVLRKVVTFVVLAGMVAGGLFAVKYFVLDQVKWTDDIAPLAAEVETARGLKFDHDVPVTTLPGVEYASTIVELTHGITDGTRSQLEHNWRALGLLTGSLDTQAVGLVAMVDAPAFYDPTGETIYVVDGLDPEVQTFSLHRALTMALLDQHFGWGVRVATASPAVAMGTRAFYDADSLAVALSLLDDDERAAVGDQLFSLVKDYSVGASPSPFASYSAGRLGVALWPYFDSQAPQQRDLLETEAAVTDGQILDLRRLLSGEAESAGSQAQGMLFWYHVLAARLDADVAWNAALGWRNDELSATSTAAGECVAGTVTVDDAHAAVAVAAFTAWAAAAPVESATTVSSVAGANGAVSQISVSACDPGEGIATNDSSPRLSLGGAPLRVEQYRRLIDVQGTMPPRQAACAAYGATDAVGLTDERGLVDPVTGWPTPDNHPLPDPVASGCVSAG